jgi:hypothetical protein
MATKQEYDAKVYQLNSATGAVLALLCAALMVFLAPAALGQIHGTAASVTSTNFGNHFGTTPGIPASITSLGPQGFQPKCCINPLFPVNPNPPLFQRHHHSHEGSFFPGGGAIYVPYPVAAEPDGDMAPEPNPADEYRGGPTIFDRRGSGQPAPSFLDDYPRRASRNQPEKESEPPTQAAETPVPDQPQTILVFKDGHQIEVQNYAVVGDMLYDLTPGHHRKIATADLDLNATAKQNDELGISFQLPPDRSQQTDVSK